MNHKQISQHQISQIKKFAEERGISLEAIAEKLTANLASHGETSPQAHKVSTGNLEAVRERLCASHDLGISAKCVIFDDPKPKRDISIEEIKSKIDKETLFLFAFVPFVIAEIAWDYADSCIDLCILMRITETKKLCRTIRELRREYDRKRYMIDNEHRKIENDNMEAFQEDYKQFFSQLHLNITSQVAEKHPGQCLEQRMLMAASYSCAVVLRAIFKYVDIMSERIANLLGITAIGSIIVSELRELERIIIQCAGEESIGGNNEFPKSLNIFVDTLVNYMLQSEMIELPCPVD